MAKLSIQAGSTGVSIDIFIQASTSTAGLGLTGLTGTSAGLQAFYHRPFDTSTPITLATSSLTAAYTSGLLVEINSTAMAGFYRFDPPNGALAAGQRSCSVMLQGAANMAPLPLEIELTAWNNQDAATGGINNLGTAGTLGSVSNVRGTATVILAAGTHAGAVIPIVQTASNLSGTVVLAPQTHTSAVIPVVQTASNLVNTVVLAPQTHTSVVIPVVQTAITLTTNADKTNYYLGTGTHTGAVIPIVNIVQTSADGRMANLDLNVGAVGTAVNAVGVAVVAVGTNVSGARGDIAGVMNVVGTSGVAISTNTMATMADIFLDRNMAVGPDTSGTGNGPRTPRQSFRALRNHWTVGTDGMYTSFKEDDTTISFAKSVISTNTANLITGLS